MQVEFDESQSQIPNIGSAVSSSCPQPRHVFASAGVVVAMAAGFRVMLA
jgi:hypothetical protein